MERGERKNKDPNIIFGVDNREFIFPMYRYLTLYFQQDEDLCIIASLIKIERVDNYVLFDQTGQVLEMTSDLF